MSDTHTKPPAAAGGGLILYFCDVCRRAHLRFSPGGPVAYQVDDVASPLLRSMAAQMVDLADRQDVAMGEEGIAGHG